MTPPPRDTARMPHLAAALAPPRRDVNTPGEMSSAARTPDPPRTPEHS
ncbi:hypothetical protein [Streptomyces sp. NPDC002853]